MLDIWLVADSTVLFSCACKCCLFKLMKDFETYLPVVAESFYFCIQIFDSINYNQFVAFSGYRVVYNICDHLTGDLHKYIKKIR